MDFLKTRLYRLLRASERHTKTDMVYLASGSFWLSLGPAVSAVLAFVLSVAFANLLTEEGYGTYRYILATAGILSIATMAGMNTAIVRAVSQGSTATVMHAFARRVEWGLLGGVASLLLAWYYRQAGNQDLALLFLLVAPFIPLFDSLTLYHAVLTGLRDFKRSAALLMTSQLAATAAVLVALFLTDSIVAIVLTYFIAWTIARSLAFLSIRRHIVQGAADEETVRYGYHLSIMSALDTVGAQADKLLIFHFLGAAALAGYAIALAIPDQMKTLLKNALTVSFPSFTVKEPEEVRIAVHRATPYLLAGLALIAVAYVIAAPVLFSLLFPQYVEYVFYTQLYALVLILVPKALHRIFFESHAKTAELYGFQAFAFVLKIALLATLVPLYGLAGALTALLLTELGVYLYLEFRIRRY